MILNICKLCGKEFSPSNRGKRGKNQNFCSNTCKNKSRIGVPRTEETIKKMSESKKGKHSSPKTEFKKGHKGYDSKPWLGITGEESPRWKGGKKLRIQRQNNKRRELGTESLNFPNIGLEGHHINLDYIVYIPKEINRFCYHNVRTGKNILVINYLTLLWLITSGEINNCKEV